VIEVKSESSQGSHSAPFPSKLVEFFIKAFTDTGDVVYDPFMGSGTSIIAAHALDRVGYGCEISPNYYCDVIVKRWQAYSNRKATLDGDGRTFDAIANRNREARGLTAPDPWALSTHTHDTARLKALSAVPSRVSRRP